MRKLMLFMVVAASLATTACNTVAGAGRDITSAGRAVTDTADSVRR